MNRKVLRRSFFVAWLLVPTVLVAWHYGPGQMRVAGDKAAIHIAAAQMAEKSGDWAGAAKAYARALAEIPAHETKVRYNLRLAHAKVRMYANELPEAIEDMNALLAEIEKDPRAEPSIGKEVRGNLASAHYFAAWLMRLEGAGIEEWTEQTEAARQHYRLLGESAQKAGDAKAVDYQKNLEAVIRLARMDLSELKGKPLPSNCPKCDNLSQRCRSQKEGKCKGGDGKGENDAREKVKEDKKKSAGQGNRPEGSGS